MTVVRNVFNNLSMLLTIKYLNGFRFGWKVVFVLSCFKSGCAAFRTLSHRADLSGFVSRLLDNINFFLTHHS